MIQAQKSFINIKTLTQVYKKKKESKYVFTAGLSKISTFTVKERNFR